MPLVKVVPHSIRLAEIFRKLAKHYCRHSGAGVPNLLKPFLVGEMVTGGIGKERNEESQASKNFKCHKSKNTPCCPKGACGGGLGGWAYAVHSSCRASGQLLSAVSQRLLADKILTLGQHSEILYFISCL